MSETHIPVLRNEILEFLKPKPTGIYVDATIGLGGHSLWILKKTHPTGRLIGIDLDASALAIAEKRLHAFKERLSLIHGNFAQLEQLLETHGINEVDGILLDLGVSSLQLNTPDRGFSFQHLGPLDMRMDERTPISAGQIINDSTPDKLIKIFKEYGEERYAKRIVRNIVAARSERPITSTLQLAGIVENAYFTKDKRSKTPAQNTQKGSKIHPATRVFQALRIAVNAELDNLALGLNAAVTLLKPGKCLCVISFHSLEDRIVKRQFQQLAKTCICPPKTPICICEHQQVLQIVTNKPVLPSTSEIQTNPRARSAKLRVAVKVKN
ncbi:MAG: 16S rRNA (cytosine(1402)-N(4))-methyltransferase RsmH [Candidatus Poribacteria bacterium]|nr:16S rRNA (cytosine(1402)-N(4))-methyltransferase RsmH [Candidatus Poribacteria bacterium]